MTGLELSRDDLYPSSSPSQIYTFDDSEDGDFHSMADSSTTRPSIPHNMSGGSTSSNGLSKSSRYQTALTARARQRQMRRMQERDGESPGSLSLGEGSVTPRGRDLKTVGSSPRTPGSSVNSTSELTRLRALLASTGRSAGSYSENSDQFSPSSQILATLHEKHRSRSLSRTREAPSLPTSTSEECSTNGSGVGTRHFSHSPSEPDLVTRDIPSVITPDKELKSLTCQTENLPAVTPSKNEHWDGNYGQNYTDVQKNNHNQSLLRASPIPSVSIRNQRKLNITPSQEFLPDWDTTNGGGALSPREVQDATNFTSIQFQCSVVSGEVEILSADDVSCSNNQCWQNEVWSDVSPPSPLASGEIFHRAAAANIVSLLTPNRLLQAGLMAPEMNSGEEDDAAKDVAGDSPSGVVSPGGTDTLSANVDTPSDVKRMLTFNGYSDPSLSRGGEWKGVTQVSQSSFPGDIDEDVRQSMIIQAFRRKMIDSSPQFNQLLGQINRKREVRIDRAYATRRKNACGALKILSAKQENRIKICWTVGVLPSISSVLSDVNEVIPDNIAQAANTEARNRIVSTLLNLSVNKKNRMLIVNTPGVLESISQTVLHDSGEGRQGCCTILLYLAKTSEAREMIVKSAGVMDALAKVIEVPIGSHTERHISNVHNSPSIDVGRFSENSSGSSLGSRSGTHEGESTASVESTIAPEDVERMEISFRPACTNIANSPSATDLNLYDADPNRFLNGARLSVFACLLCLVKSPENAFLIARDENMINTLIGVSCLHSSSSHTRALAIIAHLTRHPKNCHILVFKYVTLLPMLQDATTSTDHDARRYAFCALQNLSIDKACRAPIAHTPNVISSLTQCCKDKNIEDEWMAALATLQNLADEPANLIQFTIANNCVGTIIQIAGEHTKHGEKTDLGSFMAKNTLATLSHWFRKIATCGSERCGVTFGGLDGLQHARLEPTSYSQWN